MMVDNYHVNFDVNLVKIDASNSYISFKHLFSDGKKEISRYACSLYCEHYLQGF